MVVAATCDARDVQADSLLVISSKERVLKPVIDTVVRPVSSGHTG